MAQLTATLGASFTPTANPFRVRCAGGPVYVERKHSAGDTAWAVVGLVLAGGSCDVENTVAGPVYRVTKAGVETGVTIQVEQ